MRETRLRIDRERCIGAGMCALTAPEVFDQDPEDGLVLLLHAEPPTAHRAAAQMAAGVCPSGAITLHEPEAGGS
ncbi:MULTISPECIES: ferredoxin [unclassified Streptomyces]|uniref:ferredoxin n=1 Tax=unclassified Streptomyces TaxID=2593676 RepID=UPI002365D68F|nr:MULTISPECIES: ferredoxin [unclassified Streptomyces]MDF3142820.1 ferredoxin [Streptomyces sp. T21Q-yed]WDF42344.1 ferredoxin [Streptomyces sp. T12]